MFYILLDIDGVLNRESDWQRPFTLNPICMENFRSLIDALTEKSIEWKIILTSTWKAQRKEIRDRLAGYGIHVSGMTEAMPGLDRGKEVCRYLEDIRHEQGMYLVIDDDENLFYNMPDEMKMRLYLTNYKEGFTKRDRAAVLRNILQIIKGT